MPRPPLAMGTYGSISIKRRTGSAAYVARCRFGDFDGVTRSLERSGRSKAAAMAALLAEPGLAGAEVPYGRDGLAPPVNVDP